MGDFGKFLAPTVLAWLADSRFKRRFALGETHPQ
jgi:hypothetical protein